MLARLTGLFMIAMLGVVNRSSGQTGGDTIKVRILVYPKQGEPVQSLATIFGYMIRYGKTIRIVDEDFENIPKQQCHSYVPFSWEGGERRPGSWEQ